MYKLKVKTPGILFTVKGKQIRSPFTSVVDEKELRYLIRRFRTEGMNESAYSIEEIDQGIEIKKFNQAFRSNLIDEREEMVMVDEMEPSSTLEKILSDSELEDV